MFSDTYIDRNGYEKYRDRNEFVHRKVAENKLGRKLKKGEVVHHKDRNKSNNSADNLYVFKNQDDHDFAHKIDEIRFGKKASYQGFAKKKKKSFWDLF